MALRGLAARCRSVLDARVARWVRRRQGDDSLPLELLRRRLYILPTRAGAGFAVLLLTMLFAGLNYANSLALLVTFSLAGFAIVGMNHCHRNLLGLRLVSLQAEPAFAGETACLALDLENPGVERFDVWAQGLGATASAPRVPGGGLTHLELTVQTRHRGQLRLERLRVATAFPFGLFRCWTWVHLPVTIVVYPRPAGSLAPPAGSSGRESGAARHDSGRDELHDLRSFRDGDSPRQVAWKAYARGQPLLVKEYSGAASESLLLDFAALGMLDTESRLSQLCRWIIDAEDRGARYALHLPTQHFAADRGPLQMRRCLEALALYGLQDDAARGATADA